MDDIKSLLREYILKEFLPDDDPAALTDETQLVTGGVLDSIATLKLVGFLEEKFDIDVEAHEADVENMNTLPDIVRLVESKL